ncbi:heavy metal-associated isoprenylated plant protein 28-like isoform X2 [Spinacia oleracea]|uniref:Heavy metal-associated isoprenylated plant protein 28-like isoform X2 n=1 Tax=Spinacia oleracea TaxID=3562 RepID=A0ABM3QNA6_SPIOL|nr:heavy metal-associated isoprenylated plant protein 28-like isoform X2 [Spinacia oleracea]
MTSIVEFRVGIDCSGCENKVKKARSPQVRCFKISGVKDVEVDIGTQKVTVTGWAEQKKIQKAIMKTGLRVEAWTMPYNPQFQDFDHFYEQHKSFNYRPNPSSHHKNNGNIVVVHERTYDPLPLVDNNNGDDTFTMFNDDNPSGCSIM